MELLLATGNEHKKIEFETILPDYIIRTPKETGLEFHCEETGTSFTENALQKAEALFALAGKPVIADDSGLCVAALGGAPGIHSARYGETENRSLSAQEKYELLLTNLNGVADREAAFVCSLVLYIEENRFYVFQETCRGVIADGPRGDGGFGYDPVFYIPSRKKTMAELSEAEKNRISHRGRAGAAMRNFLKSYGAELGLV